MHTGPAAWPLLAADRASGLQEKQPVSRVTGKEKVRPHRGSGISQGSEVSQHISSGTLKPPPVTQHPSLCPTLGKSPIGTPGLLPHAKYCPSPQAWPPDITQAAQTQRGQKNSCFSLSHLLLPCVPAAGSVQLPCLHAQPPSQPRPA